MHVPSRIALSLALIGPGCSTGATTTTDSGDSNDSSGPGGDPSSFPGTVGDTGTGLSATDLQRSFENKAWPAGGSVSLVELQAAIKRCLAEASASPDPSSGSPGRMASSRTSAAGAMRSSHAGRSLGPLPRGSIRGA